MGRPPRPALLLGAGLSAVIAVAAPSSTAAPPGGLEQRHEVVTTGAAAGGGGPLTFTGGIAAAGAVRYRFELSTDGVTWRAAAGPGRVHGRRARIYTMTTSSPIGRLYQARLVALGAKRGEEPVVSNRIAFVR